MLYIVIIYFVGFLLLLQYEKTTRNQYICIQGLFFLGISFFMAYRPFELFTDTGAYRQIFEDICLGKYVGFSLVSAYTILDVEYGFYYLSMLIKYLTSDYRIYFFIIAVLQILFFSLYVKEKYEDIGLRRKLYAYTFPFFGLLYMGITIRAGLEIAMMLYALELVKKKRVYLALFIMFIAFSFHRMAIVFFFLWLVYRFLPRMKKRTYMIVWTLSGTLLIAHSIKVSRAIMNVFVSIISKTVLYKMYSGHIEAGMDESMWTTKMPLRYVFFWLIGIVIILALKRTDFIVKNYRYINIYMIGILMAALFFFFPGGSRVIDYFFLPIVLIMTELTSGANKNLFRNKFFEKCFSIWYVTVGITIVMRLSI